MIARTVLYLRNEIVRIETSHATQYMLAKGLKPFGEKGVAASKAKLTQMHQRICFRPELIKSLSVIEKKAVKGLMILTQKRDGKTNGRLAYNGKPSRTLISREEASSPTAS